jgi:hypothetical protein
MGNPAPSAPPTLSAPALALAVGLPRAFAQAGSPSLAALHLGRLRLANELPASTTTALCCPACSTPGGLSLAVRLVRSRRAKARAKKTQAHVVNSRLLRCDVCAYEVRESGSDRPTVDAFPSARKAAKMAAAAASAQPVQAAAAQSTPPSRLSVTLALGGQPLPSPAPSSVRPSPVPSARSSPAPSVRASPTPVPPAPKAGPQMASPAAPPAAASSARKKKPQTTLQKMLALNKAREEADAAAKKPGGGLLDWM